MEAYPVATDSDVENDEERALSDGSPDVEVVDARTPDLVELLSIHIPGDGLVLPVARTAVDLNTPVVPVLVGDANGGSDTETLIADASREHIAVQCAVAGQLAVDRLKNINLTTPWPGGSVSDGVSQHPESRPDTLLVARVVAAEADGRLNSGQLAGLRSEDVFALHSAGAPAARVGAVPPWNKLKSTAAAELSVPGAGGVGLKLVVDAKVAVDDVPVAPVG